jgi:hypothetical protein
MHDVTQHLFCTTALATPRTVVHSTPVADANNAKRSLSLGSVAKCDTKLKKARVGGAKTSKYDVNNCSWFQIKT